MEITDRVILDLLPLYHEGGASEDTRALVENYLNANPAFATNARILHRGLSAKDNPIPIEKEREMDAMKKAKRLLRWRGFFMGMGIFFTLLPLTVSGGSEGVQWLWVQQPLLAVGSLGIGILAWGLYFRTQWRLKPTEI